jgi:hypothetical protein
VSRALRRSRLGVVAGVLGLCLSAPAQAESEPSWLAWSAPAECQNTSEVERRLASLLGRPVDFGTLPATQVRMGWSAERGWAVRVTVQLAEGPRDRALDAPSCADAFDVIALSLALILDPSFDPGAGAAASEAGPASEAALASEANAGSAAPPVLVAELDPPLPGAGDTREFLSDAETRVEREASTPNRAELPPRKMVFGFGPLTDLGVFPVPQFGAGAQLGVVVGRLRAEVEAALLASESTRFSGAQSPVGFHSIFGALRGCYTLELSLRLEWVGCAGAELGTLGTREHGGEEHRAQGLWLAAEALTGPEFAATSWLRAFARARGVSPLIRHEFLLSEGSRVHALPWFSPQLQVGVSMDVTDFGSREH